LSVPTQSTTTLPASNFSDPFTLGTENFFLDSCYNVTNKRDTPVEIELDELVLENPTLGFTEDIIGESNVKHTEIDEGSTQEVCFRIVMPNNIKTHSDYRFSFEFHIGEAEDVLWLESLPTRPLLRNNEQFFAVF